MTGVEHGVRGRLLESRRTLEKSRYSSAETDLAQELAAFALGSGALELVFSSVPGRKILFERFFRSQA